MSEDELLDCLLVAQDGLRDVMFHSDDQTYRKDASEALDRVDSMIQDRLRELYRDE